ncbi:hypothetical protein AQUCO_01000029v1 [Aquilegia coerulea]|uniref:Uncharacterized protein n=1 Tax=Aquilegia coerulea TaxID=218851 RepID=A0A2G5E7Y7_AQUCA|nr:hypothetical protein AQUCO_01000029v1 [Aquilegia coerulea]
MASKLSSTIFIWLILLTVLLLYFYSLILPFYSTPKSSKISFKQPQLCNFFKGKWIQDPNHKPLYDETCPFHRNSWNCLKNQRENMGNINSWKWVPENCSISSHIDPFKFLELMRNKNIGFVGDSLNENFIVSFLCILRVADNGAKKWKKKGAWRGGYFPKFNVTVAYHRAVLLAKYQWQPGIAKSSSDREPNGVYRVDVDTPAEDWVEVTKFYNVLVFNTGHWWGIDKFPKEKPLVFYLKGQPIVPPLGIFEGLKVVLDNIVSHIQREVPRETLKFWRMQSPRHFYGGEWNENGSCLFNKPLEESQVV